ncbi:MAG: alpha-amylase family glycosyl hydrolase [Cyclonatronaceae bacterium]
MKTSKAEWDAPGAREARIKAKGTELHKKGCRFSVWAPHADEVYVTGSFNKWNKTAHPMTARKNGVWTADIAGVKAGDEYRYRILNGDKELLRIDPYARRVTHSAGNAIIRDPSTISGMVPCFTPPMNEMIIYELHIGTFGKEKGEEGPGTLKGAIRHLPYLRDLGVNVIEIMPLAEFAGGYSWGYNPAHIFAVESDYGRPREFREFVDEAHKLGLAVVLDVVYNHFGPSDLDLWQFDGWSENDKGGIYFYNDWRSKTPWGDTRPDYGRPEVREYIRDNALMWLCEYNVDGLRWDMTAYIRNVHGLDGDPDSDLPDGWNLMQLITHEIKQICPNAINIAEDLQNNPWLTRRPKDGGAGFDTQWNARFVHNVRHNLLLAEDAHRDMDAVRDAIIHRYYLNAFERVIYTESHDEVANGQARVPEELDPGSASSWVAKKKSTLGAALVFTSPGIPMIFQGQEFLEDDWFHDQDPVDWSRMNTYAGILQLYKDLIGLRKNDGGVTAGLAGQEVDVYHVNHEDKMIAWHRWNEGGAGDSTVVIANFSAEVREASQITFPASGTWFVRFNSDSLYYDSGFSNMGVSEVYAASDVDEQAPSARIRIAPYSVLILSQNPDS